MKSMENALAELRTERKATAELLSIFDKAIALVEDIDKVLLEMKDSKLIQGVRIVPVPPKGKTRGSLSPEGLRRIKAGQKRRWDAARKAKAAAAKRGPAVPRKATKSASKLRLAS